MVDYEGQKAAKPLVAVAVILFIVQLIAGALMAFYILNPYMLSGIINFQVIRAYHLDTYLFWLFAATFAVVIYLVPILSGRDFPSWIKLVPYLLLVVVIGAYLTFPLFQYGTNIWIFDQPLLVEGREFVEMGRLLDILLFLGFIIFAVAILKTLPPPSKWNIPIWALVMGAAVVFFLYIPGNIFIADVPLSEYFRWWTVHYWVEGALEVAYVGAVGIALMLMIPDERIRPIVEKYVFYDVILAATSGIIGQGHHYFWIGTPTFWIILGGLISVMEVIPLTLMIVESYRIARELEVENRPAYYHITGIMSFGFVGVALFGLSQTWPWTNWFEHGTWVTPSHGHICAMAFGMGALGLMYLITPGLSVRPVDDIFDTYGRLGFWFLLVGTVFHSVLFALMGNVEIFHRWILREPWQSVFAAKSALAPFLLFSGGLIFVGAIFTAGIILRQLYIPPVEVADGGVMMYVARAFFGFAKFFYYISVNVDRIVAPIYTRLAFLVRWIDKAFIKLSAPMMYKDGGVEKGFFNTLDGMPIVIVIAVVFSLIASAGLWSFSSYSVIVLHNPLLPYTLSTLGYVGMGICAVIIAVKLARGALNK